MNHKFLALSIELNESINLLKYMFAILWLIEIFLSFIIVDNNSSENYKKSFENIVLNIVVLINSLFFNIFPNVGYFLVGKVLVAIILVNITFEAFQNVAKQFT